MHGDCSRTVGPERVNTKRDCKLFQDGVQHYHRGSCGHSGGHGHDHLACKLIQARYRYFSPSDPADSKIPSTSIVNLESISLLPILATTWVCILFAASSIILQVTQSRKSRPLLVNGSRLRPGYAPRISKYLPLRWKEQLSSCSNSSVRRGLNWLVGKSGGNGVATIDLCMLNGSK